MIRGSEPALVQAQFNEKASIFACDEFAVFREGAAAHLGNGFFTSTIPPLAGTTGKYGTPGQTTNSWLNAGTFMQVWDAVNSDGRFRRYDWTVKVDPDTVFLANRLRRVLAPHTTRNPNNSPQGHGFYLRNCARYPDIQMLGSFEVFSQKAVETYLSGKLRCVQKLHWQGWGEDYFVQHCLDMLGVSHIEIFNILGDANCAAAACSDASQVALHPYKVVGDYLKCWHQAIVA